MEVIPDSKGIVRKGEKSARGTYIHWIVLAAICGQLLLLEASNHFKGILIYAGGGGQARNLKGAAISEDLRATTADAISVESSASSMAEAGAAASESYTSANANNQAESSPQAYNDHRLVPSMAKAGAADNEAEVTSPEASHAVTASEETPKPPSASESSTSANANDQAESSPQAYNDHR
eukprot:CAMPEP_0181118638 /NCGR_PEP_ID=MMETSP1071-20121207/23184_1 /TAXON_ID=35127 /ORGANISM="Thalassiosira sp., Strain NH16" /LENGTH=179 /DNA_ID=CAMNT_0023203149 /DNA_START=76 /DNA_END=611 /DNA_ORIENTATION=+